MPSKPVPVTAQLIEAGKSVKGGWSQAQLAILGIAWPPPKGWIQQVIGRTIPKWDADRFVALRGCK